MGNSVSPSLFGTAIAECGEVGSAFLARFIVLDFDTGLWTGLRSTPKHWTMD